MAVRAVSIAPRERFERVRAGLVVEHYPRITRLRNDWSNLDLDEAGRVIGWPGPLLTTGGSLPFSEKRVVGDGSLHRPALPRLGRRSTIYNVRG